MAEGSFQNNFFDTEYLKADLKGRSVRGGAATMAAQGGRFFLQMGSTVVLARLLTPEDYGLVAMVGVVTNFVMMFKDMGLSMATVQKADIDHAQISTLFWINVAISLIIITIMAALAPVVTWFYGKPELTLITLALAGTFIFGGLTIQHQALLRRHMHFGKLAVIEIAAMFSSVIAAIISAWYGAGYWALVIMQLVMAVSIAIGVWFACDWRPSLPKRGTGIRPMLAFGGHLTGFNFVNYFARNTDKILIGKFIGPMSLGFYNKAYNLLMLPIQQINAPLSAVSIPALSRLQNEPERYRNYYLKAISIIALITMPCVVFMMVMSRGLIRIALGSQWEGAIPIFFVFAIGGIMQPIANSTGWLFVSQGRSRDMFRWGLIGSTITVVAIIVGLPWGAIGIATSYTIFGYLGMPLLFWFVGRTGPVRATDIYRAVALPLCVAFCTLVTLLLFGKLTALQNPFWEVICGFGLTLATVLITLYVLPSGQHLLKEVIGLGSLLLGKKEL